MSEIIYRIQDAEGRGPYRPGFSHNWTDETHNARNPPFMVEFGMPSFKDGEHGGCGFRSLEQLRKWFSSAELLKLKALGYSIVSMEVDRIAEESKRQLVFGRKRPLSKSYLIIPWSVAA